MAIPVLQNSNRAAVDKSADAYRTISEVADELKLPQHVLRFWETRFPQIKPMKRGGNRRFYRPEDVELLRAIRALLYGDGYTIKGVQRILKEQGPRAVAGLARSAQSRPPRPPTAFEAEFAASSPAVEEAEMDDDPDMAAGPPERSTATPQRPAPPRPREGPARSPPPDAFASRPAPSGYLSADWADRLEAVLYDLSECERLLSAARA